MSDMAVMPESEAAPPDHTAGLNPRFDHHKVGMACFLVSEVAFFSTLIMVYLINLRNDVSGGPTPREVLSLPLALLNSVVLISSSVTIHFAEAARRAGNLARFHGLWALTILLGAAFVGGTLYEWRGLIRDGLTIDRNMFGTTYYTLVGFHAAHVTIGVGILAAVLGVSLAKKIPGPEPLPVVLSSWYWHFVDAVWIVVFTVVYLVGR